MTLGYDPVPFLNTNGIDSKMLLDPDATVPMSVCVGLLEFLHHSGAVRAFVTNFTQWKWQSES